MRESLIGWRSRVGVLAFCTFGLGSVPTARAADATLSGYVRDENETPVAGAHITVRPALPSSAAPWQTGTDLGGAFSLALPAAGDYLVDVSREGYYELNNGPIHLEAALELTLVLNRVREVFQSVDVNAQPSPIGPAETQNQERLTGTHINSIPYANSHSLRDSMKLMPGVVVDTLGGVHFNGSSENQVQYQLNGFNLSDPVSGEFRTTLAVEGIRSMNYASGRYSPEFGKGTAGVLAIATENGTDAFHYTATDFIPGVNFQRGLALGNWYPRLGVSGPIARGRAWFSDTFHFAYTSSLVTSLPSGQNTRSGRTVSDLLHTQVNLTPRHILFTDFLVNFDNQDRVGLGPLDPVSTTQTVHAREYFGSVRDQYYFSSQSLLEFGYAHNGFSTTQTPQGQALYVFSPAGRSGNYFVAAHQTSSRDEGVVHWYAPQVHRAGTHQVEAGADGDSLYYNGSFERTGYQLVGLSQRVLSRTSFFGPGDVLVHDTEIALWALDTWQLTKRLQIDAGLRLDWDQLVGDRGWSPRLAFSWAPFAEGKTRVSGGYSVTHDAVPLGPFGSVYDQVALTTQYDAGVPLGPPTPTTFVHGSGLKLPRATNWTLGADHAITAHFSASVKYLRRSGTDGFNFLNTLAPDAPASLLPLPNGTSPGVYQLVNLRRDHFDSVQLSVRQSLDGQHEWMASYTRSRAHSNAVLDPNTAVALQVLPDLVPMPWDSPDRMLGWAYLPLPWKNWSVAVMADARSGFPFSVIQETGIVAGGVNSYRYPFNFDLNLAIERMITLHGYRFALRGGVNNLTDSRNPTAVNNVIGSPEYLQFLGDEGRHFVLRIRFFGRTSSK